MSRKSDHYHEQSTFFFASQPEMAPLCVQSKLIYVKVLQVCPARFFFFKSF